MSVTLTKIQTLELSDRDLEILSEADVIQVLWALYHQYEERAYKARDKEWKEKAKAAEQDMIACESLIKRLVEFLP